MDCLRWVRSSHGKFTGVPTRASTHLTIKQAWHLSLWEVITIILISLITIFGGLPSTVGIELCTSSLPDANVTKEWEQACQSSVTYCYKGIKGGVSGTCPRKLVYNAEKGKCDYKEGCNPAFVKTESGPQIGVETEAECPRKPCGLYPANECNTYFICSGGIKIHKKCVSTNVFDLKTKECRDPRLGGKCWQEISSIKPDVEDMKKKPLNVCPFHGFTPSQSATEAAPSSKSSTTGITLHSPAVTNYGEWQPWAYCSAGFYFTGMAVWRRSTDADGNFDHAGVISLGFKCENPLKKGKGEIIGQYAPGAPDDKWFNFLNCEDGAAVGFQLSQQEDQGPQGDDLATDSVRMACSCGKEKLKQKPYHEPIPEFQKVGGLRGTWTEPQFCQMKQAICGFRTQMDGWQKEKVVDLSKFDMTAMNQLKVKCCNVESPGKCSPKETKILLQTCDNRESEMVRRCPFNATVGVEYNIKFDKAIPFYESIGHELNGSLADIKGSIGSGVGCEAGHYENGTCAYNWESVDSRVLAIAKRESGQISVRSGIYIKLFQIIAHCGIFAVHTNKLIKIRENAKGVTLLDDTVVF